MEENIQIPDSQDDDRELRRAFQYAANLDRYDQLAELGRQLLHDQNIRRATVRRWLPWAVGGGAALFCLGFWLGRQVSGDRKPDTTSPGQQLIPAATQPDSFAFYVPSGEKFVVRTSAGDSPGTQAKLEVFTPKGRSMGDFYQNDTLHLLIIKPQPKPPTSRQSTLPAEPTASSPVAVTPTKSENSPSEKPTILVADPKNKGRFLNGTLPARRIRVAGEQKTIEPLPAVRVNAFDDAAMRSVFFGDQIRLSVPAKLVEGQPVEILEFQGAGAEDGFYLRIGSQFFRLEKSGYSFDLNTTPKPKAFD